MKKTAGSKELTFEGCTNYLTIYKQKYLILWEEDIRFLLRFDETRVTTQEKRQIYTQLENKLRGYLLDMQKIYQDSVVFLKKLDKKIKEDANFQPFIVEFMAVQAQCLYYGYQVRKILITICRWYYEEPDKKTTSELRLQALASEWDALRQYYEKNKETILKINDKEERQFAEMEDDLTISIKLSKGEVLSPLEKVLRTAEVSRNQDASDKLFIQAMSMAETDVMRYRILKKRTRYHVLRENRQIGNGFYKTMTAADNAGIGYINYIAERAKEKMALLAKINSTGEYDLDELDLAQEIFSFCKVTNILIQVAIAKKNHEERYCLIQVLKDCRNITKIILQKFPLLLADFSILETSYLTRKEEWQYEKELMAKTEVDAKLDEVYQKKLQDEYDAAFSIMLTEFGYTEVIKTKQTKKKKTLSVKENFSIEAMDSVDDGKSEVSLIFETPMDNTENSINTAMVLLNQAEEHKKNAKNILNRQGAVREAIIELESTKSTLEEALEIFNEQYADDKVLKEAILLVLSHTESLLKETIEKLVARVEKLNAARASARHYIIKTYGVEAWYKDAKRDIREMSQYAKDRITAIHNLNRLQALQQGVEDLKNSDTLHLAAIEKRFEESAPNILQLNRTRHEVREYFRFFRSHCPAVNSARQLTRSSSVDSFLSPEQTAARGFIKKVYGS